MKHGSAESTEQERRSILTSLMARTRGFWLVLTSVSYAVERERYAQGMCHCCGSRYWKEGGNRSLYSITQGRNSATLCPQCSWTRNDSCCCVCNAGPERWCSEVGDTETPLFLHSARVLSHLDAMRTAWKVSRTSLRTEAQE